MIRCNAGRIGNVSRFGLRLRPLCCVNVSLPPFGVLLSETDDIGAPLPREQQERQRKPRLAPDRVTLLELLYLLRTSMCGIRLSRI